MRRTARPTASPRPRGRLVAAVVGAVLASALGLTGAIGLSLGGQALAHGSGHGVHTDVQSWS